MSPEVESNGLTSRPPCHFYGLYFAKNSFVDSDGSHCGLKIGSYGVCDRVLSGEEANWSMCRFREIGLGDIFENVEVFSKEMQKSVKLRELREYLLAKSTPFGADNP